MFFELIPVSGSLWVEGTSEVPTIGEFRGHVVAIGVREYDPIASPQGEAPLSPEQHHPEGLAGWGTTHFLVCDVDKRGPVWVPKADVERHAFDPSGTRADARGQAAAGRFGNGAGDGAGDGA